MFSVKTKEFGVKKISTNFFILKLKEIILPTFILKNSKNLENLEKFKLIIFKKLSIENIVNHLHDIDKLKYLVLSNHEVEIFDSINLLKFHEEYIFINNNNNLSENALKQNIENSKSFANENLK